MNPGYYKDTFFLLRELSIRALEAMPADQMSYHPPNSRSAGEIALHLADSDYAFTNPLTGLDEKPAKELTLANYPTQAAIVGVMRDGQRRTAERLGGLTQEALDKVVRTPFGTDGPAEVWLSILLFHEADHKGNLVIMAKTLGGDPPDFGKLRALMAAK